MVQEIHKLNTKKGSLILLIYIYYLYQLNKDHFYQLNFCFNFQQLSARSLRFVETKFLRWPCIARGLHFGEPRGHQVPPVPMLPGERRLDDW